MNSFSTMKITPVHLHEVKKGSRLVVIEIPEGQSRSKLIRLGVVKGEFIRCLERLPGGTVVIQKHRQEIAIGVTLARTIVVAYVNAEEHTKA
jgi:Fe2+ transport system protein FeoA